MTAFLNAFGFGLGNILSGGSSSNPDTEADLEAALPAGKAYIVESGVYVKDGEYYLIEDI